MYLLLLRTIQDIFPHYSEILSAALKDFREEDIRGNKD